jgi:hypothetical protein
MALARFGNDRLKIEINEPGVHPVVSFNLPDGEGSWAPAVLLGARQVRYFHKGASFPRLIADSTEIESSPGLTVEELGGTGARLAETRHGFSIETTITFLDGWPILHVAHRLVPEKDTGVNRVFDRFDFVAAAGAERGEALDYLFVPHLRPRPEMMIADQVFRSPVVMMQRGDVFFAVIPDLELLERAYVESGARYYMDFVLRGGENLSPAACVGLGRHRVKGHVYFENNFSSQLEFEAGRPITLAYYLLLDRGGLGRRDAVSFMWERFARGRLDSGQPQTASWDRYAAVGLDRIFKKPDLFRRFDLEGQQCGGTVALHFVNRRGVRLMSRRELGRYLRFQDVTLAVARAIIREFSERPYAGVLDRALYRFGPKVPPQIMFQAWFNNFRSAYGAYWFARKWGDRELLERSLAVKNLAILAPREKGAFPAVCYATDGGVFWSRGTRGFKHLDWYHTADCATTGYYMTLWFTDHEGDPRLLARCHELAEFLLKAQLPSGAFGAWVQPAEPDLRVAPELRESATTACPAMFLAQLFLVENDERYIDSAMKAARFLAEEVIPAQKWFDYETFYSCSHKRLSFVDANTGSLPQNAMSMYWAAEAMRLLHLVTLDPEYLDLGLEVLNHLCLYQQVWDPPFLSINAFGGFGSMNTDAEWNDARQALMAPLLMDYYRLTGRPEHMERGIAALRAAFTLMYIDENRHVARGNMKSFHPEETGSVAENYAHFGYDHSVPGFLDSDWGAGSACQAAAYVQKHYGDIFVDADRQRAFGINGCRVDSLNIEGGTISLQVTKQVDSLTDVDIRLAGSRQDLQVEVNGSPARKTRSGDYRFLL